VLIDDSTKFPFSRNGKRKQEVRRREDARKKKGAAGLALSREIEKQNPSWGEIRGSHEEREVLRYRRRHTRRCGAVFTHPDTSSGMPESEETTGIGGKKKGRP